MLSTRHLNLNLRPGMFFIQTFKFKYLGVNVFIQTFKFESSAGTVFTHTFKCESLAWNVLIQTFTFKSLAGNVFIQTFKFKGMHGSWCAAHVSIHELLLCQAAYPPGMKANFFWWAAKPPHI